jgi:hypothetical protein
VIAALVLRMTSDPADNRGLPRPPTRAQQPRVARPRAPARPTHTAARRVPHPHLRPRAGRKATPGTAGRISSNLAYAAAPYANRPALELEAERQRDRANDAGEAQRSRAAALHAR